MNKIHLPRLDKNINHSPHVVILGAGASIANYKHSGEIGKKLPSMNDLIEIVELKKLIEDYDIKQTNNNFEAFYDYISSNQKYLNLQKIIEERVYSYFKNMVLPDKPTIYDYLVLSLREKDLIATFNWDPLLLQAYERNLKTKNLPKLAFFTWKCSFWYL